MSAAVAPIVAPDIESALFADGHALVPGLIDATECAMLRTLYQRDELFRSRVVMERHRFGRGEYRYFAYPLPPLVERLRRQTYDLLAPLANRWMERLGSAERFPLELSQMLARCGASEQTRPTPLLLKYGVGDFNCLHQDLYGDVAFPLQMTVFLNAPNDDYTGGEFVLAEQRPRSQTRVDVLLPARGDAIIFPNRLRPVTGTRGTYRATVRHGVSAVRSGERYTLGLIFHDAR
jgi:uncharacterized protein